MVNAGHVQVVCVARGERFPAELARVDKGAGKVLGLHVGLEVALGAAHLPAEAAAEHPRTQRLNVVVKSVQVGTGSYKNIDKKSFVIFKKILSLEATFFSKRKTTESH